MTLMPDNFCPDYYLDLYADVVNLYGRDHGRAERHYRSSGIDEGRSPNPFFVPKFYLDCYSDLREAFGGPSYRSALQHWLTFGIREGRSGSQIFDPKFYLAEHPDLQSAFGSDYLRAYSHWIVVGIGEARRSSENLEHAETATHSIVTYRQKPSAPIVDLLADLCPTCKAGELEVFFSVEKRGKAILREILNPGVIFFDAPKVMYFQLVRRLEQIYSQYRCKACKAFAAICPNCSKAWRLADALDQLAVVQCPHCKHEFWFKYG